MPDYIPKGKSVILSPGSVSLKLPFTRVAIVTVSFPLSALFFCFFSSVIFKYDIVNETVCNVQNFIPSISAVTGVAPQCYVWRVCIALQSTPRLAVAVMYYNEYLAAIDKINPKYRSLYRGLIRFNYWLNMIENMCLILVTYISNRDNYPLHEKIFIVFMTTSIMYMLLNTILFKWCRDTPMNYTDQRSYFWKKTFFVAISSFTIGLLWFFWLHRWHCVPLMFSFFSLCEYGIAVTNMSYHMTSAFDFADSCFIAGSISRDLSNGTVVTNDRKHKVH